MNRRDVRICRIHVSIGFGVRCCGGSSQRNSKPRVTFLIRRATTIIQLAVFGAVSSLAQTEGIKFERISLAEGLSQSIVDCIIQDQTGFMWFGTEDGLNRYDGYEFRVFRQNPDSTSALSHDNISALHQDRSGFIWIGTFHGGGNDDAQATAGTRFPLPINAHHHFQTTSVELPRNETIVMFTDGIVESFNAKNELYDVIRLKKLLGGIDQNTLSAKQMVQSIPADTRAFSSKVKQSDDKTVVVVKVG